MQNIIELVMDAEKNPLAKLPKPQRFQLMTYLGLMWSTIFTFGIGYWAIYGQLVVFHLLVALGVVFTSTTFSNSARRTHREVIQRPDSTPLYDDIWGAP